MNKASCLSLLCNAVLVWNTVHMSRIIEQLRASGVTITRRGGRADLPTRLCPCHSERHLLF